MPPPRPPSRVEPLTFPVFGMSWFANPGDGTSIVSYCGGGGSARTGVNNSVIIMHSDEPPQQISTGDKVGIAMKMYVNPVSGSLWLIVAMAEEVRRYRASDGSPAGSIDVGDPCSAINVSIMADVLAVGCESGAVKVYAISDDKFDNQKPLFSYETHEAAICSVAFSAKDGRLISSAKDGTARIWKDGELFAGLKCSVPKPEPKPNQKRPPSAASAAVLVRGCVFGDLEGKLAYTVASGRRGKAYLTRWIETPQGRKFACDVKTCCSDHPVSAMSLSEDGRLLGLGSTDGTVTLWSTEEWAPIKVFPEVHAFPVTCMAVRPYDGIQLNGEEDGVQIHARTASADSQLACLTLQRRAPKKKKSHGDGTGYCMMIMILVHWMIMLSLLMALFYPVFLEAKTKCQKQWDNRDNDMIALRQCLLDDVFIAPPTRPGISSPPY